MNSKCGLFLCLQGALGGEAAGSRRRAWGKSAPPRSSSRAGCPSLRRATFAQRSSFTLIPLPLVSKSSTTLPRTVQGNETLQLTWRASGFGSVAFLSTTTVQVVTWAMYSYPTMLSCPFNHCTVKEKLSKFVTVSLDLLGVTITPRRHFCVRLKDTCLVVYMYCAFVFVFWTTRCLKRL